MKCRYCSCLNWSDKNDEGDVWCTHRREYVDPYSEGCGYNDDKSDGKDPNGGCYLTTAMCSILGKPDNCFELETLRSFRGNYMKKDKEGQKLLREYDLISPPIAKALENSENSTVIAKTMLNNYINPAIEMISKGEIQHAIGKYKEMVLFVKEILNMG